MSKRSITSFFDPIATKKAQPDVIEGIIDSTPEVRLCSWNVNGIRAVLNRDEKAFDFLLDRNIDICFLSEIKCDDSVVPSIKFPDQVTKAYPHFLWNCCKTKKGYSGLLMMSKIKPISTSLSIGLPGCDDEGRVIVADFGRFTVVNCYVPNSGQNLDRLTWRTEVFEPHMRRFLNDLHATTERPVIYSGDLNVALTPLDLYDSSKNQKTAGHHPLEREQHRRLLAGDLYHGSDSVDKSYSGPAQGTKWVDVWRRQNGVKRKYSFYGARSGGISGGKGWRIDFWLVNDAFLPYCSECDILNDIPGSDHFPITLTVRNTPIPEDQLPVELTEDQLVDEDWLAKIAPKPKGKAKAKAKSKAGLEADDTSSAAEGNNVQN